MDYVDTNKVSVRPIDRAVAKKLIIDNHYSHTTSHCQFPFGVYYNEEDEHDFFDTNEKLIGCMTWGWPVGRDVPQSIVKGLTHQNTLELTRLWVEDGYGKNIESLILGYAIRWIKRNLPHMKALISYSDMEFGHRGIIYQATNWSYQGLDLNVVQRYWLGTSANGPWTHPRTLSARHGTVNTQTIMNQLGCRYTHRKLESKKHRYIYLLGNYKERRSLLQNLKHPIIPYPKEPDNYKIMIERMDMIDGELVFTTEENA